MYYQGHEIKLIEKEYDYGFKKTLEHHSNGFGMRKQFNWSNLNEMCPNLCSLPYQKNILRIVKKLKSGIQIRLQIQIALQSKWHFT